MKSLRPISDSGASLRIERSLPPRAWQPRGVTTRRISESRFSKARELARRASATSRAADSLLAEIDPEVPLYIGDRGDYALVRSLVALHGLSKAPRRH